MVRQNGLKPAAMFRDSGGNLCHDCVVNVAAVPGTTDDEEVQGASLCLPAMASNYDDFMGADQADALKTEEGVSPTRSEKPSE